MSSHVDCGISARRSSTPGADVDVDGDASLLELHRRLLDDGLADVVVDALRRLDGEGTGDYRAVLRSHGVTALNDHLADVLATATQALRDLDLDPDGADDADVVDAIDVLGQLGDGTVDGLPSDLDDLDDALPPLLAGSSTTPTVSVRLGLGWASRRREQRERVLRWLTRLGLGARVDLVVGDGAGRRILDDHRADVPAHVLSQLCNRGRATPAPLAGETDDAAESRAERVADALDRLDPDGRPAGVLDALADAPTQTQTYSDLARELVLDAAPYEAVSTLDKHLGLVERTERSDGATVVSLRPAGLSVATRLGASVAVSGAVAAGAATDGGRASTGVSDTPQNSPSMPYYPGKHGGGEAPLSPAATAPETATDRPAGESDAATADGDRVDGWQTGLVTPEWAPRSRWLPAVESVDAEELALVSADLDLADDRDGRTPVVSYARDRDVLYTGAEYHNPAQAAVTLAHGLTSERLWTRADLADRIGDDLSGLEISERDVLRSATRIGWLPDDVRDGDDVRDQLRDAREDVLDLCRELSAADDAEDKIALRGELASTAIGLVGVVVHLLDLAGVQVVLDYRIDELARHFSPSGNDDRRDDLLDHLRKLSAICSRSGAFGAFAQLLEHRDYVREDAWTMDATPGVDAAKPACSMLVHGGNVESLSDDLVERLSDPVDVHPDAPDLRLDVDVRVGTDRHRLASTARRMLRSRGLRPTATATAVLAGMVADPWVLADSIHWGLARETPARDVHLDEVRAVLATADSTRLLPDASPAARAGVAELARASEPLSQAELCRRAGISTQSWRNHRDGLVAADWVRETERGWRLALPFGSERGDDVDVANPPWWLKTEAGEWGDFGRDGRRAADVVDWLLLDRDLLDDVGRLNDPDDPVGELYDALRDGELADRELVDDVLRELGVPPALVRAGCGVAPPLPEPATASVGPSTRQTSFSEVSDTPQNPPIDG